MDPEQERDAERYRLLRDYLLLKGIIKHVNRPAKEGTPFVSGDEFYGPTFADAVDALEPASFGSELYR